MDVADLPYVYWSQTSLRTVETSLRLMGTSLRLVETALRLVEASLSLVETPLRLVEALDLPPLSGGLSQFSGGCRTPSV